MSLECRLLWQKRLRYMKISQTSTYYVPLPYLHRNVVLITTGALIETEQNLMLIERPTNINFV